MKAEQQEVDEDFDLSINRNALDEEWLRQPNLHHEYALKLAEARLREDEAKQKLELVQSTLEKEIRDDPEVYEITKSTEAEIKSCIVRQPEYRNATKQLNNARYRVAILVAAVGAIETKRRALENLVELHGQDYFAEPRARTEEAREAIGNAVKRNIRRRAVRAVKDGD